MTLTISRATIALSMLLSTGCAASAHFHSKTGARFEPLAEQAVRCSEDEANAVVAAGGFVIGTIDAKGTIAHASDDDVADRAVLVAARKGGTHVVLTDRGTETWVVNNPGTMRRDCVRGESEVDCVTTFTPPTQSTYEKRTARFVVFRLGPAAWSRLPQGLRPIAAR
jgi:hypothetical protein